VNYYDLLGIRSDAHPVEIDAAYKMLSNQPEIDDVMKTTLRVAHQTLMNPNDRHHYNQSLASGSGQVYFIDEVFRSTDNSPWQHPVASLPPSKASFDSNVRQQMNPRTQHKQQEYQPAVGKECQPSVHHHWAYRNGSCDNQMRTVCTCSSPQPASAMGTFFVWFCISYMLAMFAFSAISLWAIIP